MLMTDNESLPNQEQQKKSDNRQIVRAAGTVMLAMVFSQLTGLLAKMLMARSFGAGTELDAFFAANRLPETLFMLVAGGALGSSFIPVFTTFLTRGDRETAWKLVSSICNMVILVMTILCILAAIFAPQIVRTVLAPGFDAEQQEMTVHLLRILLPGSIIFGVSGLVMGILNAYQVFIFPALAPAMYQVGLILGTLILSPWMGIDGLAWGAVLGAGLHLIVQIPRLLRLPGRHYQLSLGLNLSPVREVLGLMGPRILGVAVVQLNFWLNTYLATSQSEGSLTGINLAFPLMLMPQAAIAQSTATAALPTFSAQVARGRFDEMRRSLSATLRVVLFLAIPATLGLVLLRKPIVAVLYEGDQFTAYSTELVAWALLWYGLGLVAHSAVEIISRAFYALHDTRTPVVVGVAAMSLNLAFSMLFSALFIQVGWAPHGGLALANTLATFLEMIALLILMRRRLEGLEGRMLWSGVGQAALATLCMSAALLGWLSLTQAFALWIIVGGGIAVSVCVYIMLLMLLRVSELQQVWSFVRSKLARRH